MSTAGKTLNDGAYKYAPHPKSAVSGCTGNVRLCLTLVRLRADELQAGLAAELGHVLRHALPIARVLGVLGTSC